MEATIPTGVDINMHSIDYLAKVMHKSSIFGLNIELQDDQNMDVTHVCSFMPTLSSLHFKTKMHMLGVDKSKKPIVIEMQEDKKPFLREPLSYAFRDALRPVAKICLEDIDSTSSSSSCDNDSVQSLEKT